MAEPLLKVEHLTKEFPVDSSVFSREKRKVSAVSDVSFRIYPGQTLGLVGESGCGKSTTGRALLRLVATQGGTIVFNGERIDTLANSKLQALRRDIQFIFQDPFASLDPRQTVGYSIMEPLRVHGMLEGDAARARVPLDALSVHLHAALNRLGEITGEDATEDVITRVFQNFCVGK